MQKTVLARALRRRQKQHGDVPAAMIDALSDDAIIDAYITCAHCGAKQVTPNQLQVAISMARDANQFFTLCDQLGTRPHDAHTASKEDDRD